MPIQGAKNRVHLFQGPAILPALAHGYTVWRKSSGTTHTHTGNVMGHFLWLLPRGSSLCLDRISMGEVSQGPTASYPTGEGAVAVANGSRSWARAAKQHDGSSLTWSGERRRSCIPWMLPKWILQHYLIDSFIH